MDGDRISFYCSTTRRHTTRSEFDVTDLKELPTVEILYSYVQPGTALIQALTAGGVKGIVMAGTGAGLISEAERAALAKAPRPVIVRSNRTGTGRVLLMLGLTKTEDRKEIRRMIEEY